MEMESINWRDFEKVELRIGEVIGVEDFPEARKPAYKITVNFGDEIGIKKTSAQITENYTKDQLLGKQIIGVVNFPARQIGPVRSEFLLTGFYKEDKTVVIAMPEQKVPNGAKLG